MILSDSDRLKCMPFLYQCFFFQKKNPHHDCNKWSHNMGVIDPNHTLHMIHRAWNFPCQCQIPHYWCSVESDIDMENSEPCITWEDPKLAAADRLIVQLTFLLVTSDMISFLLDPPSTTRITHSTHPACHFSSTQNTKHCVLPPTLGIQDASSVLYTTVDVVKWVLNTEDSQ